MKSHIQEVLEVEKKAKAVHAAAVEEAEKLPVEAEREAQALLEKARNEAEEEAHRMVEEARSQKDADRLLAQAEEKANQTKSLAMSHFDRAVGYVLDRIAGRE
jgi:V/A-type H+-transporting ATPase subunit G/H